MKRLSILRPESQMAHPCGNRARRKAEIMTRSKILKWVWGICGRLGGHSNKEKQRVVPSRGVSDSVWAALTKTPQPHFMLEIGDAPSEYRLRKSISPYNKQPDHSGFSKNNIRSFKHRWRISEKFWHKMYFPWFEDQNVKFRRKMKGNNIITPGMIKRYEALIMSEISGKVVEKFKAAKNSSPWLPLK